MKQLKDHRGSTGQEEPGRKMLHTAENTAAALKYVAELAHFFTSSYGFRVTDISPAKRGFYGETWNVRTETATYFLKIDYWSHHEKSYQNSLPIVQYMTSRGISFIPKIIKTKSGHLYSRFQQGTAAVFSHIPGELSEEYSTAQLYSCLAEIYRLETDGLELEVEDFGAERIHTFLKLQSLPELPAEVKSALAEKEPVVLRYMERLNKFSTACGGGRERFHITHGDAGGNCILNGNKLFLVDWDSVMLAPIERDAWIFICNSREMQTINSILAEKGINYVLEENRLCYYCYDFFFYYLNEYLRSIIDAKSDGQSTAIIKSLMAYLTDCWIYERLEAADAVC